MKDAIKKIKMAGIAAVIATGGVAADYYALPRIEIYGEKYTQAEYSELRPAIVKRYKEQGIRELSFDEGEIWKEVAAREMERCRGFKIHNANEGNILDTINRIVEMGEC